MEVAVSFPGKALKALEESEPAILGRFYQDLISQESVLISYPYRYHGRVRT